MQLPGTFYEGGIHPVVTPASQLRPSDGIQLQVASPSPKICFYNLSFFVNCFYYKVGQRICRPTRLRLSSTSPPFAICGGNMMTSGPTGTKS